MPGELYLGRELECGTGLFRVTPLQLVTHPSSQLNLPRCAVLNRQPLSKGAVCKFPICEAEGANIASQFSCLSRGLL